MKSISLFVIASILLLPTLSYGQKTFKLGDRHNHITVQLGKAVAVGADNQYDVTCRISTKVTITELSIKVLTSNDFTLTEEVVFPNVLIADVPCEKIIRVKLRSPGGTLYVKVNGRQGPLKVGKAAQVTIGKPLKKSSNFNVIKKPNLGAPIRLHDGRVIRPMFFKP